MRGRRRLVVVAALALVLPAPAAAQSGARQLLPDLRSRPQEYLTFSGLYFIGGITVNGCYPDEIVEDGARRCLRFDQSIANLGEGPFELRYEPPDYVTDPFMYQRIYRSDGTFEDRKAEQYEFHPTHAHFHYKGFAQSRLWASDSSGARLGDAPVRVGRKNGFCVMDIEKARPDAPPPRYTGDGCIATTEWVNGITEGWADTYGADLPDQYIEVSGVKDGYYQLETVADPDGTVVELDEANNTVVILIRLDGSRVEYVRTIPEPASARSPESPPAPPPPPAPAPEPAPAHAGHQHPPAAMPKPASRRTGKSSRRRCKTSRKRSTPRRKAAASARRKSRCTKRRRARTA